MLVNEIAFGDFLPVPVPLHFLTTSYANSLAVFFLLVILNLKSRSFERTFKMATPRNNLAKPKVVLITGCSTGGIGASLVYEFARQGCIVYASARKPEAMDGLVITGDIRKVKLDVNDPDSIDSVVKTIMDSENRIDILVNNA